MTTQQPIIAGCICALIKKRRYERDDNAPLVIIPIEELKYLKNTQQEILLQFKELRTSGSSIPLAKRVKAKEFLSAVKICRSKFDQLVITNKIKTIKKRRKIYVPTTAIDRYFSDPSIL